MPARKWLGVVAVAAGMMGQQAWAQTPAASQLTDTPVAPAAGRWLTTDPCVVSNWDAVVKSLVKFASGLPLRSVTPLDIARVIPVDAGRLRL